MDGKSQDGRRYWMTFKIEKLPNFCFVCEKLDRLDQDCNKAVELMMANKEVLKSFDYSLRADRLTVISHKNSRVGRLDGVPVFQKASRQNRMYSSEEVRKSHSKSPDRKVQHGNHVVGGSQSIQGLKTFKFVVSGSDEIQILKDSNEVNGKNSMRKTKAEFILAEI
ncbi:hypothetical protein PTKIN_Ptkin06aG0129000 [Pterospermum kingtungense]